MVRLRARPSIIRLQSMSRKWGSCSTRGTVTLATELADEPPGFQDFVIVHELLHLRVRNHGKLFKALLTAHVPHWKALETGAGRGGRAACGRNY